MARRLTRSWVLVLLVLSGLPAQLPGQAESGERALRWRALNVEARLDAEGRLRVREQHAMVFDGDWNGGERGFHLRMGQQLTLHGLTRLDRATGEAVALEAGGLDRVDEFDWVGGSTLRWRSRLPSDPPFRAEEIVYQIDYSLWPVLISQGDDRYLLRHDFAFPDRAGVIERFDVSLEVDEVWSGAAGGVIREGMDRLEPGRGYTIELPLQYRGTGAPSAVPVGASSGVRGAVAVGALLVPLWVLLALRRRQRELERVAPLTSPDEIDLAWLETHLFAYPAEVIGAAWDRSVGAPEVAALLARLVQEGKLSSRVEPGGRRPVLHLRRIVPFEAFPGYERELISGLFFDGREETDTEAIREHYRKQGFDPASTIRAPLNARLKVLPGEGDVPRQWGLPLLVVLAGATLALLLPRQDGALEAAALGLIVAAVLAAPALVFAAVLSRRVTHRGGPTVGTLLPIGLGALLLALLSLGAFERIGWLVFYRPEGVLLLGLLVVLAGIGASAVALSRPTERAERLAFRRALVSAKEFFEGELGEPQPRLQDAWFPYLLAFGLGPQIDRWFEAFGASIGAVGVPVVTGAGRAGSHGSGGWSGGGVQFGGGHFAGGGAGGSWGVAATGLASGVSPPSSSGGGGGAAASGGGSGGGW